MQTSIGELTNAALSILIEIAPGTNSPGTHRLEHTDSRCPSCSLGLSRAGGARRALPLLMEEIAPLTPIPLSYRRTYGRSPLQGADSVGGG